MSSTHEPYNQDNLEDYLLGAIEQLRVETGHSRPRIDVILDCSGPDIEFSYRAQVGGELTTARSLDAAVEETCRRYQWFKEHKDA